MSRAATMLAVEPDRPKGTIGAGHFAPEGVDAAGQVEDTSGLSTDFLNHYSEALMLIEMAAFDGAVVADLSDWRPIDYRAYFRASPLRRAGVAVAAYDALSAQQRSAFEQIIQAVDKLALAAILALQRPCDLKTVALISEVISPAIRRLIDRAAAFLNSGGIALVHDTEAEAQAMVDRLIER